MQNEASGPKLENHLQAKTQLNWLGEQTSINKYQTKSLPYTKKEKFDQVNHNSPNKYKVVKGHTES